MDKKKLIGFRKISELTASKIKYQIRIGYRQKGELFVTTPAIRHAIVEWARQNGQKPYEQFNGAIYVSIDFGSPGTLRTYVYDPFGKDTSHFSGKGIATLIELQIEKQLSKQYPHYSIISNSISSNPRNRQITQRGRTPGEPIPIREAVRLTREKAINDYRKTKGQVPTQTNGKTKHPTPPSWKTNNPLVRGFRKILRRLNPRR